MSDDYGDEPEDDFEDATDQRARQAVEDHDIELWERRLERTRTERLAR